MHQLCDDISYPARSTCAVASGRTPGKLGSLLFGGSYRFGRRYHLCAIALLFPDALVAALAVDLALLALSRLVLFVFLL